MSKSMSKSKSEPISGVIPQATLAAARTQSRTFSARVPSPQSRILATEFRSALQSERSSLKFPG